MKSLIRLPAALLLLGAVSLRPGSLRAQDSCGEREAPPGPLVSAEWLKQHRQDPQLILLDAERTSAPYDSAHIGGARFIGVGSYTTKRGELLTELPPVDQLRTLLQSLGVGDRGRIVLYGDILPVTRLYFTLDYLGLGDRVSVMDGGLGSWRAAGGALTAVATPAAAPTTLTVKPRPEVLADAGWVDAHRTSARTLLLDARTREEFDGVTLEDAVARAGHIPGAVNLDWTTTMEDGKFRPIGELRQLLQGAGADSAKEIVTYCRVGTRASALYFVARLLGYQARIYDGSMNEWGSLADLPVVKSSSTRP